MRIGDMSTKKIVKLFDNRFLLDNRMREDAERLGQHCEVSFPERHILVADIKYKYMLATAGAMRKIGKMRVHKVLVHKNARIENRFRELITERLKITGGKYVRMS